MFTSQGIGQPALSCRQGCMHPLQVWLTAGQSNMVFALGDVLTGSATFKPRAQTELGNANDPNIRTFQVG